MQTKTQQQTPLENLSHLPAFADYLLTDKLDRLVEVQMQISREITLPLMRLFDNLSQEELYDITKQGLVELLTFLAQNKARQQINFSLEQWKANQLPLINKEDIVAEDITMITYLRKKSFLYFIPHYCSETEDIIELIKEIDLFLVESETAATNTYISLLKDNIQEHSHFIEKITNTSPGIIYVYDVLNNKEVYANKATTEFLGYSLSDITALGNSFVETLIHPGDLASLKQYENDFKSTSDGEIRSFKYRMRNKKGEYRWLNTYETVFKRNANGEVSEKIGIAIDINQQKITADELEKREAELLEAQQIARLGSFTWDLESNQSTGSLQTNKIFETDVFDFNYFKSHVHPEDVTKVETAIKKAMETGLYECEYRFTAKEKEKAIWSKGIVSFTDGKPVFMTGTVMDVSGQRETLHRLQQSEALHKTAEGLTHIGSYTWNLNTNEIAWSDELYHIYGLDPHKGTINSAFVKKFNHPDDMKAIEDTIKTSIETKQPFDFYYRIQTKNNQQKILHAKGNLILDAAQNPVSIIGTAQDVTEKQTLIRKLEKSEKIYRQAEALSNMGNWSWDVNDNKLEWTDQLYRIYGLEPQSVEMTNEIFLSFIHPDDRAFVEKGIEAMYENDYLDYTFRIIAKDGTEKVLRSIAHADRDENGKLVLIVGSERDVTEKQKLIDRLKQSENLYKQAQSLAHVGNWSWDMKADKIEWSDELYRIFGLESASENISFQKYLSFLHPEDQELVTSHINKSAKDNTSWEFSHRIIRPPDNEVRIIYSTGQVMTDADGKAFMMFGTAQDITERQQLINRLQQSEQLYKQAQFLANMGNWSWELETNKVEWSEEMYKIYELAESEEITFDRITEFMHPDDREEVLKYIQDCIAKDEVYDKHHRIILQNGKMKTIHRRAEIIKEAGKPVKMVGTTQDVTEFYRVQQELKENQTFIRKITDATPSIIASYNVNTGNYVFISEGLEKLLGYDRKEAMEQGKNFFVNIIHPDDAILLQEKNAKALADANANPDKNDFVIETIYRMRHKNGRYRWFHTYGTFFDRNKEGRVEHVLNISLDVTHQQEATQKIKEQEHFIQQIADASPTILYLYDVDTQSMVYINREIFFVLGYLPDEIIDAGEEIISILYHPDDYPLLPERKQSAKNFQQVDSMVQYECRLKSKEDDWRWFLVREIVFKTDEHGKIKQILGAALDINRRKEMEKTILQNTLLLEQSNASLEEFAYVASHDLKEPLRKISTFGDRLVATHLDKLSDDGKIYLKKIVDASQRMQTMISDLLSISMISGNREFEMYSLQKVLDETIQTLEYKIEQQQAVIRYGVLPEVNIILSQFRQLFQNLLSNSLKFVREGVQPLITITHSFLLPEETVHYQLVHADKYLKIEFSDNGIGFENEFAGKIFAIFQRLHGRSEYEGSGIGLAICKKIVEHHGGIIYATGNPAAGATFTIVLPV